MTLVDRYLAGEHEAAWDEIYDLPVTAATMAEVEIVADETMRRVHGNLSLIVQRLDAQAFSFHSRQTPFGLLRPGSTPP
ncbi:hypothetical protein ABZT03_43990 [Streptomyces sp. NPDC005574]|uniref:hypothetical protein n=1 Tax=Streptomyces sp. NPDC005574 TaxID=3156891 RepID=UPI0033BDC72E